MFAGKKSAQIREILINESAWEEMTCLFAPSLGRSKVCCLYTGDVVIPSDLNGLIYKKFNSSIEEVAYSIIKDLRATGYAV